MNNRPASADEIKVQLLTLGLNPDAVDLDWIARIKAQVEESIAALRNEDGFQQALPLFRPEARSDGPVGHN